MLKEKCYESNPVSGRIRSNYDKYVDKVKRKELLKNKVKL